MQRPDVQVDDATKASVTYVNRQKDKLTVVFSYDKSAYYEYTEDPHAYPSMCSQGVELVSDIYLQPCKKRLLAKLKQQYEEPVLISSARTRVKHKYIEYGKNLEKKR